VPARPIFVAGTASHVGKSWVATAICRYLFGSGHKVAPFKAQNMSNNSMACPGGGEIGRSQAAQAAACGLEPHPDMNPILLKPSGSVGSQLVLNGRPWQNIRGRDYDGHYCFLFEQVVEAYERLASQYDYVVVEGAGSVAELNLKRSDLVNLTLAERIDAPVLLVADIDRGGVFGSVVGTLDVLEPPERARVRSFLVNRFRGDPSLFADGVRILESRTGLACLGVFPFAPEIHLDAEDGVSLEEPFSRDVPRVKGVAVIALPHISNFTDFALLGPVPFLRAVPNDSFDTIILPGTKSTIEDLAWLRASGLADWIVAEYRRGVRVVGVCGGFQMLGETIQDPGNLESTGDGNTVAGLGLLPVQTSIAAEKTTRPVVARTPSGAVFDAYEIHMGRTTIPSDAQPFAVLDDRTTDGIRLERIAGTYLHGALENADVARETLGVAIPDSERTTSEVQYDRLARWFAAHADLETFRREFL
jgi:adenosylcobyric acid synthase